ncbi:MAG TPA: hypothetical protein VF335_00430 [Chitinivibrionales bacterium]
MIIHGIVQYRSLDVKSKSPKEKIAARSPSNALSMDTYEPSVPRIRGEIREDLIASVKKKINNGFYQSKDVLDQLSDSFAQALNPTV